MGFPKSMDAVWSVSRETGESSLTRLFRRNAERNNAVPNPRQRGWTYSRLCGLQNRELHLYKLVPGRTEAEASRLPATETRRVPKTERAASGLGCLETGGLVDWMGSHTASKPERAAWPSHAASKTPAGATSCGMCGSFGSQGHRRFDAVSLPVTEVRLRQLSHWWRV
jgi:hypothetical protein